MRRIAFALRNSICTFLLSLCFTPAFAAAPTSPGPYTLPYSYYNSSTQTTTVYTKAMMTKTLSNDPYGAGKAAIYFYNGTAKFHGGYSVFKFFNSPKVLLVNSVDDVYGNGNDYVYEFTQSQDPDDPYWFGLANDVCFTDAYLKGSHDVRLEAGWPQQPNYYQNSGYHCNYYFYDDQANVIVNSGYFVPTFRNAAGSFRTNSGSGGQCVIYVRAETDIPYDACHGDAANCYNQATAMGYAVSTTTPRVGSIIVFAATVGMPNGHVGVVTAINGNNLTIQDSNWNLDEAINSHVINKTNYTITGYIYYAP